jgi:hypothetical protein
LGVASMKNVGFICVARTLPAIVLGQACSLDTCTIANSATSLVPCIVTPNSSVLLLTTSNGVFLDNSAAVAHPILQLGTTAGDPGSTLSLRSSMGFGFSGATNVITGAAPATATVQFKFDGSVLPGAFATANPVLFAACTYSESNFSGGAAGYTPAVGADWVNPDPTTVGAAIDRIAAVLAAGGGGAANPIP